MALIKERENNCCYNCVCMVCYAACATQQENLSMCVGTGGITSTRGSNRKGLTKALTASGPETSSSSFRF